MIKKEIEIINGSLEKLKECIEVKRCVTKKDLDDNIDNMASSLERLKEQSGKMGIPHPVPNPDLKRLIEACDEYLQEVGEYGYGTSSDLKQWIYEEALKSIYGEKVFNWINKQMRRK